MVKKVTKKKAKKKRPVKKTVKKKITKKKAKPRTKKAKKGEICEHSESEMCSKCLYISRELLLCGELDEKELLKVRQIMTKIITKKGVFKEEVKFLNGLSDMYLS
jgi:hypothetical protein